MVVVAPIIVVVSVAFVVVLCRADRKVQGLLDAFHHRYPEGD